MLSVIRQALWRGAVLLAFVALLAPVVAVADTPPAIPPVGGQIRVNAKDGALLVFIPAGDFIMGSTQADTDASSRLNHRRSGTLIGHRTSQEKRGEDSFDLGPSPMTKKEEER